MPTQQEHVPVILVVDDDSVLSLAIERYLSAITKGYYEIIHVTDGSRALAVMEQRHVPLVITDYHLLSSINGLKLTSKIRQRSHDTRVVLITAYATPEVEQAAAVEGVDFYLPKPFLLQDLEQVVRKVLMLPPRP